MKSIVIDACCLGRKKTGNETYVRGLLNGLACLMDLPDPAWGGGKVADRYRFTILTSKSHTGTRHPCFEWIDIPLGNFLSRNFKTIPDLLKQHKADLYHASYWTRFWNQPCPSILMVHDLSFVSFPQGFHKHEQIVYSALVRKCAQNARHLLTVSEFSKQELMTHWKIPARKITVTYNGIDSIFQPAANPQPSKEPYLLYVGNLHPRKNLERLIEAFVQLKSEKNIPHVLKIVGQSAWLADDIFTKVRLSGMEKAVEFTGYVQQNQLVTLYQNAALTVYPSLYEGFGLPPLEAMASGCPVVTSNRTSLPEVTGGNAVLINPESSADIARGLYTIIDDETLRKKLAAEGPTQARSYSWHACAVSTMHAYKTSLDSDS